MLTVQQPNYTSVNFKRTTDRQALKKFLNLSEYTGSKINFDAKNKSNWLIKFLENNWFFKIMDILTGVDKIR